MQKPVAVSGLDSKNLLGKVGEHSQMAEATTAASHQQALYPGKSPIKNPIFYDARSKPAIHHLNNSFGKDESEVGTARRLRDEMVKVKRMTTGNSTKLRRNEAGFSRESRDLKDYKHGYTAKPSNVGNTSSRSKSVHFLYLENVASPRRDIQKLQILLRSQT